MQNPLTQQKTRQRLTKKQKGFVDDFVLTENGTQSALKNYDTTDYKTASVIASENLDKPSIQVAIEETKKSLKNALIEQGITPQKIAKKINYLLESDDFGAVDKGLKHSTNIYGVEDLNDKPKQGGNTYNFIFSQEVQDRIKVVDNEIKDLLTKKHVQ